MTCGRSCKQASTISGELYVIKPNPLDLSQLQLHTFYGKQIHKTQNNQNTRNKSITSKAMQYRQDIVTQIPIIRVELRPNPCIIGDAILPQTGKKLTKK